MKKQHLTHTTRQLKKKSLQQEGGQADTTTAQKSRVRTKHPNTGCWHSGTRELCPASQNNWVKGSQFLEGCHSFAYAIFIREYSEFGIISTACCWYSTCLYKFSFSVRKQEEWYMPLTPLYPNFFFQTVCLWLWPWIQIRFKTLA